MRITAAILVGFSLSGLAGDFQPERKPWTLQSADLKEASGLARSTLNDGIFWAVNDGSNASVLHRLDRFGGDRGRVAVEGVSNRDWEDLSAFRWRNRSYLLIADTGDNRSHHKVSRLLIVPEPGDGQVRVSPAWEIRFQFEDGPRDTEAVAVDERREKILLLSKRTKPPVLYELALRPVATPAVARRVGEVRLPPAPFFAGPYGSQPTGLAINPSGTLAAVLTYWRVLLFERRGGESWADALARAPHALARHGLEQAEAVTFSCDGTSLLVVSEGGNAPVQRYTLRNLDAARRPEF